MAKEQCSGGKRMNEAFVFEITSLICTRLDTLFDKCDDYPRTNEVPPKEALNG